MANCNTCNTEVIVGNILCSECFADRVKVIRCKDCKHASKFGVGFSCKFGERTILTSDKTTMIIRWAVDGNHYCAWAEIDGLDIGEALFVAEHPKTGKIMLCNIGDSEIYDLDKAECFFTLEQARVAKIAIYKSMKF